MNIITFQLEMRQQTSKLQSTCHIKWIFTVALMMANSEKLRLIF